MFYHYHNDSATPEWLSACREWESEGERTPAQRPRPVKRVVSLDFVSGCVDGLQFDERTPAFLRRQVGDSEHYSVTQSEALCAR